MRKSKKLVRSLSMAMAASMIVSSSGMSTLAAAPSVTVEAQSEVIEESAGELGNLRIQNADAAQIQNLIDNTLGKVEVQLTGANNTAAELLAGALDKISGLGYGTFAFTDPSEVITKGTTDVAVHFVNGTIATSGAFTPAGGITDSTPFKIRVNVKGVSLTASELKAKLESTDNYGFKKVLGTSGNETSNLLGTDLSALQNALNTKMAVPAGFTLTFVDGSAIIEENTTSVPVLVTVNIAAKDVFETGAGWTVNEDGSITTVVNVPLSLQTEVTDEMVLEELKTNLGLSLGTSNSNIFLGEATYKLDVSGSGYDIAEYFTLPTSKYGTWSYTDLVSAVNASDAQQDINVIFTYNDDLDEKGYTNATSSAVTSTGIDLKVKINKYEIKSGVDYLLPIGYDEDEAVYGATLNVNKFKYADSSYDASANPYVTISFPGAAPTFLMGTNSYAYVVALNDATNVKFAGETAASLNKLLPVTVGVPTPTVLVTGPTELAQNAGGQSLALAADIAGDIAANGGEWTVTYQWYKMVNGTKTIIDGQNSSALPLDTSALGKTTYVCDVKFEFTGSDPERLAVFGSYDGNTVYTSNELTVNVTAIEITPNTPDLTVVSGRELTYDSINPTTKLEATVAIEAMAGESGYKLGKYEWSYKKTYDAKGDPITDSKAVIIKNGTIPENGDVFCNVPIDLAVGRYEFYLNADASNGTSTTEGVCTIIVDVDKALIDPVVYPKATAVYGQKITDAKIDLSTVTNETLKSKGTYSWPNKELVLETVNNEFVTDIQYTVNDSDSYKLGNSNSFIVGSTLINVSKADLTISAKDIEITTADKLPDVETVVEGLVLNDTLKKLGIVAKAEYAENTDATKPGTYDIVVTLTDEFGAPVKDADNYNLKAVNGKLTVKAVEAAEVKLNKTAMSFDTIGAADVLKATVGPEDTFDKTVTYTSSNSKVAAVDADGIVKAVGNGTAVITAKAGNASAVCNVKVSQKASQITVSDRAVTFNRVGATKKLTVSAAPSNADLSGIKWSSSNSKVASVDANGTVKAVADGTAVITAAVGNVKATSTITVTTKATGLTLSTSSVSFDTIGATKTVTASVTPANSSKVAWSTSNSKVATVSASGVIKAVGNGTATITAKAGDLTKTVSVKVSQKTSKVSITYKKTTVKGTVKVTKGKSYNFDSVVTPTNASKENAKVTWKTSNKKIATVSSTGTVKIKGTGTVTITATTADGKKASVKLKSTTATVKATKVKVTGSKTMKVKGKQTLKVTVSPVTVSNSKVKWTTSNKSIATVSSKGVVTAKKAGTVKITATTRDGSKKKSTITIKVTK